MSSGRAPYFFFHFARKLGRPNISASRTRAVLPPGRPKTDATIVGAIRASLAAGISIRKAAKLHGVGISTVQRVKASTG